MLRRLIVLLVISLRFIGVCVMFLAVCLMVDVVVLMLICLCDVCLFRQLFVVVCGCCWILLTYFGV